HLNYSAEGTSTPSRARAPQQRRRVSGVPGGCGPSSQFVQTSVVPLKRDSMAFSIPPGTDVPGYCHSCLRHLSVVRTRLLPIANCHWPPAAGFCSAPPIVLALYQSSPLG